MITRQRTGVQVSATLSAIDLFLAKVDVGDGCWIWRGALTRNDADELAYGVVGVSRRNVPAHRFGYELLRGPISPASLTLDHLCRNRRCVRPSHLEPVPMRINTLRGMNHVARLAAQTACKFGHPFDERNTYRADGRHCRECHRRRNRAFARRQRAARAV